MSPTSGTETDWRAANNFNSLRSMRDVHNALLSALRARPEDLDVLSDAERFVRCGAETGVVLDRQKDRWAAQSMLDYWSTLLFRAGAEPPDAILHEFDPSLGGELDDALCPYPGPSPYGLDGRDRFVGRERLVAQALEMFHRLGGVALVGEAGSGKTSLLHAGVLPSLERQPWWSESGLVLLDPTLPGSEPIISLARVLSGGDPSQLSVHAEGLRSETGYLVAALSEKHPAGAVLVVDSLEEIHTLCTDDASRIAYMENLIHLAENDAHRLVLTMRTAWRKDFSARDGMLRWLDRNVLMVTAMTASELERAIRVPAERVGLEFEEGLIAMLVRDFNGEPLPLLQSTLKELWEQRTGRQIPIDAYTRIGRGRAALARRADELYGAWGDPERALGRRVFLELAGWDSRSQSLTNRTLRLLESDIANGDDRDKVRALLSAARAHDVVRIDSTSAPDETRVELIDKALIEVWPTFQKWNYEVELDCARAIAVKERARAKHLSRLTAGILLALLAALAGLFAALADSNLRRRQFILQESSQMALSQSDVDLSLALAARANEVWDGNDVAEGVLLHSAYVSGTAQRMQHGSQETSPVQVRQVAVSPDGRRAVSGGDDGDLIVWDLASGLPVKTLATPEENPRGDRVGDREIRSLALGRDGQRAVTGSENGNLLLWDLATGDFQRLDDPDEGHGRSGVRSVAIDEDDRLLLSVSRDRRLNLWDLESGKLLRTTRGAHFGHQIRSLGFVPGQDAFITAAQDGTLVLARTSTGEILHVLGPAERDSADERTGLRSVAIGPDGCVAATGSEDQSLVLWDLSRWLSIDSCPAFPESGYFRQPNAHGDQIRTVGFSSDGRYLVSGGEDQSVVLWRVGRGVRLRELRRYVDHHGSVFSVAFGRAPSATLAPRFFVSASQDGSIRWRDMRSGVELRRLRNVSNATNFRAVAVRGDTGPVLAVSSKGLVVDWDLTTDLENLSKIDSTDAEPSLSDDGRILLHTRSGASGGEDQKEATALLLTNIETSTELHRLVGLNQTASAMSLDESARYALAGSSDGTLVLWDAQTGERLHRTEPLDSPDSGASRDTKVSSVAVSGRAALAVAGYEDGHLELRSLSTFAVRRVLTGHATEVRVVAFAPGSDVFATGSRDHSVILWDVGGGVIRQLRGHTNEVRALAFSPDGRTLMSGSEDRTVALWHVESGRLIRRFHGHLNSVRAVRMSPDGTFAVSADDDGQVILWGLLPLARSDDLLAIVRDRRFVRRLSPLEEERYDVPSRLWSRTLGRLR